MQEHVYEGKKLEEIIAIAEYELNKNKEELIYTYEEQKGGLLKSKKIVATFYLLSDIANYCSNLVEDLLKGMSIKGKTETKIKEGIIYINIISENNSILIGKKGHILDSLNIFIKQAAIIKTGKYVTISLDIENYKDKQKYFLQRDVKKIAKDVLRTKIDIKLDPMKSYERRIVHDVLSELKNIETISEGIEPNRGVIIKYKED